MRGLFACAALWLAGCGDGASTPNNPREFYLAWYRIECAANARCCHHTVDVNACAEYDTQLFTGLTIDQLNAEIAGQKIAFSAAAAARCLAAHQADWARCDAATDGPFAGCDAVLAGVAAIGAACAFDYCDDCLQPPLPVSECAPGSWCRAPGDPTLRVSGHYTGVCAPRGAVGDPCATGAECATGVCAATCQPPAAHAWTC
jgi:hypothetical protein